MLVKENSSTKIIEDKMGFKFKDLILIGKIGDLCTNKIFYKDDKNTKRYRSLAWTRKCHTILKLLFTKLRK